ncbi:MAG: endolytic transglycosylase MltG [Clostridiaceae bacterium]|nr:endolytic transglycosylase MltG [Eubacteriales bacterium]
MRDPNEHTASRKPGKKKRALSRAWRLSRPVLVLLLSLGVCALIAYVGINKLLDEFIRPVDANDATPVTVTIESGASASEIAKALYEAGGEGHDGLIKSKAAFSVYVDFTGKSSKLKAGTYVLSRNMDISQIVDEICKGNPPRKEVSITIPEGMDIESIAAKLEAEGVIKSAATFMELCKTGAEFTDYSFVAAIPVNPDQARDYVLEGYLFPDTYNVYSDTTEKAVILKMLMQFFYVYGEDYVTRAAELDMSTDQIVTLASLIEKEAVPADFKKVSAVFYNRMAADMDLGSDAPLRYIYKLNTLKFTSEQVNNPSLYNTHTHKGLPLGPITNPGKLAIEAALYPDEDFLKEGYLYFCLKNPETGELVYAKTLAEHQANVDKYSPLWQNG